MAKPTKALIKPALEPTLRLPWPQTEKEISGTPRLFRVHRLNAFELQAYVTENGKEYPIGKPDTFDIIKAKIAGVMKIEGQQEFIRAKAAASLVKHAV